MNKENISSKSNINWFPGHMARARNEIKESLKLVDLTAEIVDARIPFSSRNPNLDEICGLKPRVVVLNKIDLIDKESVNKWIDFYKKRGIPCVPFSMKNSGSKNVFTAAIKNIMKEAYFVSQNKLINELFRELQKNKKQIAIIIDEYGGTAGLITMEDILEEIFGDIYDEYDEIEQEYEKIDDKTYIISGSMPIYDVNKLLNANIPEGDYDTLSGYLQEELGRIPKDDEKNTIIETKELVFKIEEYEDKRILKVKVYKNEKV